ncbi:MAG: DUF4375 domain-containing protein [Gemmatales bacterium]
MTYGETALAKHTEAWKVVSEVMKVVYGRDDQTLTPGELNFALTNRLIDEVSNGGFDQYFFNGGYAEVHAALKSLVAFGATQTAALVQQAIKTVDLPDVVSEEYDYAPTEEQSEELNELDSQFYDSKLESEEIYPRLVEYLREHVGEFA